MRFDIPDRGPAATPQAHHTPAPTHVKAKRSRRLGIPRLTSTKAIMVICILSVLVLAALSGFLFWQNNKLKSEAKSSDDPKNGKALVKETVEKVSKLYNLPKGETPTVAAITDVSKLKGQDFFDDAMNGDRILIYEKAKIAILYRDSENKIINTGPVQTQSDVDAANNGSQNGTTSTGTNGATATPSNQ